MSEKNILLTSVYSTILFAVLGITWGVLADSGMIIFDGIYSLISVGLSILSLMVLKQVQQSADDKRFPFGKAHFEPLLVIFKSLMLLGMCLFSALNATSELLGGGREVAAGPAVIYAIICTLGCLIMSILLHHGCRENESNLLRAERNQWYGDTLLSAGVLLGFSATFLMQETAHAWLTPYADPSMVIIASCTFVIFPVKSLTAGFREILFFRVDDELLAPINQEARLIADELDADYKLRMINLGRELDIELNFLMADRSLSVSQMDEIRNRLAAAAKEIKDQHWININFTKEKSWV